MSTIDGEQRSVVMSGGGCYNRHSGLQAAGIVSAISLFGRAASEIPTGLPDEPTVIGDYGSSQGRNSLKPLRAGIRTLRTRAGPGKPICVYHTDQSQNDFCSLFDVVASDPGSYTQGDPNVFAYAVGRSFYGPLFPPAFVSLGWSSWSAHWLSRAPMGIPDSCHPQVTNDLSARTAFELQAASDWTRFLKSRSSELKPGGKLVMVFMSRIDNSTSDWRPLVETLNEELSAMVEDGFITPAESVNAVVPTYRRSRAELLAPFESGQVDDLAIDYLDMFACPDPIWEAYNTDRNAQTFAENWAAFCGAALSPSLAAGLDKERTAAARVSGFYNRIEQRIKAKFADSPQRMPISLVNLMLSKRR